MFSCDSSTPVQMCVDVCVCVCVCVRSDVCVCACVLREGGRGLYRHVHHFVIKFDGSAQATNRELARERERKRERERERECVREGASKTE